MDRFVEYPLSKAHRLLEPGPVIMLSTAVDGVANLMTNGFNMPVRHEASVAVVVGPWDYSFQALRDTGECVIALPGRDILEKVVDVGNTDGDRVDKWEKFGFTPVPAEIVAPPLVAECFANIECTVQDDRLVEEYDLWVLRMRKAWIAPDAGEAPEVHHRGNGTFSTNAEVIDVRSRMTKWPDLVSD